MNKAYLDANLSEIDGHLSLSEKNCNEYTIRSNKQSIGNILIQRVVKTTIQVPYDKGIIDHYINGKAYEFSKDFLFVGRRRGDLQKRNDVAQ